MSKVAVSVGMLMVGGLSAFAGEFPYTTNLNQRYYTNATTLASYKLVDVPKVGQGMLDGENVAVITMDDAAMTALDEDGWAECTNRLTGIQAAFTLKSVSDTSDQCVWMGYTGGAWQEFTGKPAVAGTYTIAIEIDYTDPANRVVRYSVNGTVMQKGSATWVPLGTNASKVNNVQLCGYGTTGAVEGSAATRPIEGTIETVEDVSMDYSKFGVGVTVANAWGVDTVRVTLKGAAGNYAIDHPYAAGTIAFDFTGHVTAGETYTYDVELVNSSSAVPTKKITSEPVYLFSKIDWFGFKAGDFVNATESNIVVDTANNRFSIDDDSADEPEGAITPDAASATGLVTIVESVIFVESATAVGDLPAFAEGDRPQFAVAMGADAGGNRAWAYYDGLAWQTKAVSGLPTNPGTYTGKATFDYRGGQKTVSYEICPENGTYVTLVSGVALGAADRLNEVAIRGGTFGEFNALCKVEGAAPLDPAECVDESTHTITVTANGEIDLDDLEGEAGTPYTVNNEVGGKISHLRWTDVKGSKYAKMVNGKLTICAGNPQNGLSSYDSYALGLDADTETDKPAAVVKPSQDQSDGVVLYVPNLAGKTFPDSGYTPYLQVQKSSDGGLTWTDDGSPLAVDSAVTIPFNGTDGTTLYRVNTILK